MRGPSVFQGYYKDAEATAEVLDGGWLATGDLAAIDDDGFVRIIGRKKDLIITSSGKNISPSNIENQLKRSRWISEAIVFGDARPYLVALLSLDPDEAPALARELGADPDPAAMAATNASTRRCRPRSTRRISASPASSRSSASRSSTAS